MVNSITKELEAIDERRYGVDLREPIHDALFKVNESGSERAEVKRGGAFPDRLRPTLPCINTNTNVIIAGTYDDGE